jgi:hypothetical protein
MAQVIEHLPNKLETPSSNPSNIHTHKTPKQTIEIVLQKMNKKALNHVE